MLTFVIIDNGDFVAYLEPFCINTKGMRIIFKNKMRVIYTDEMYCYKIFKNYDKYHYIQERLEILLDYSMQFDEHFLFPDVLYQKNNDFYAYRTLYLPNSCNFENYFSNKILFIAMKVDALLRRLHKKGFVFGDFHFGNVLIDEHEVPYLIDFDNIVIPPYKGLFLTQSFQLVAKHFQLSIEKDYSISQNTDKICFYLCLLELYFGKYFLDISLKEINAEENQNL